jgi:adenylate cyclase
VASGTFDCAIEPSGITELDALAHSFNQMTRGLRERADMQKFVSQSTVQMIQSAAPAASASARKELTVLFSDIRGFTRFSEAHAPEAVVAMLNECLGLAAERVRTFGGDVDKFVGDCVVALFDGVDRDLRAIRCAVDIQRAMDAKAAAGGPVAVGIGIASGEVVVGSIGGGDRFDYTAVGLQVNLASRLCAMAEPREILMSEATWLPVRDLVAAERRDEVVVRGRARPVAVYRMVVGHERGRD